MPKIKTITVPADYETWLGGLRKHLDRHHGSRADLARHLAQLRGLKPDATVVRLSKILNQGVLPGADIFLDIATWLADQET